MAYDGKLGDAEKPIPIRGTSVQPVRENSLCKVIYIRAGYELVYDFPTPTALILTLNIHPSRASDLIRPDHPVASPSVPISPCRDSFGNWRARLTAPMGELRLTADAIVQDSGQPDRIAADAGECKIGLLPAETLVFLLGSRYCETDLLSNIAWELFSVTQPGWARVQAICDFVHKHLAFGYEHANSSKTALAAFNDRTGVCRDYAHLAITFCRCMNIPARYCCGYLSDIGVPPPHGTMDFAGWFEAYLDGEWYAFDPRNNEPRIGRILIARGRDAADVAISTAFGANTLKSFKVWTDELN